MLRPSNTRGFSLIELLIVVAIIGVLSTIGIPTFKNMVKKAKQSEAKVALGGLATAQAAFMAEYNVYGNQVVKLGFDMDGNSRLYAVGFTDGSCNSMFVAPDPGQPAGATLSSVYSGYYTGGNPQPTNVTMVMNPTLPAGSTGLDRSNPQASDVCYVGSGTVGVPWSGAGSTPAVGVPPNGVAAGQPGPTYLAAATGAIAAGSTNASPADGKGTLASGHCQDVWTIDSNKALVNLQEGI